MRARAATPGNAVGQISIVLYGVQRNVWAAPSAVSADPVICPWSLIALAKLVIPPSVPRPWSPRAAGHRKACLARPDVKVILAHRVDRETATGGTYEGAQILDATGFRPPEWVSGVAGWVGVAGDPAPGR